MTSMKTNTLNVPTLDHNLFTFKQGTFTAFASDLKGTGFKMPVFKGSVNCAFKLKGKVHEVLFLLVEERRNDDGDVTTVVFEPSMTDSMKLNLGELKVLIFNT